jgi:hypothetical protein
MTAEAVQVKVMDDMIEFTSPNMELANRVFAEFGNSCKVTTYLADPGGHAQFEQKVREEFSPQRLSEEIGFPLARLGDAKHQFELFRHARLFIEKYAESTDAPIVAIERTNNLDHWADIVDVLSKCTSASVEDLRERSYDILEKRMTPSEYTAFRISDR